MAFKITWQYEHELLRVILLHPTEDKDNFSTVLSIHNRILPYIDMSCDSNQEPVPQLLDNDNIVSNQPRVLQPKQPLWLHLLDNQDFHG